MRIKFYGTRGSSSISGEEYTEFGGATSCIMLNSGKTSLMIDCGSGVINARVDLREVEDLYLIVTHPHLDHIEGIVNLIPMLAKKKLHIYGKTREGRSVLDQLELVMQQPLWPVAINQMKNIDAHELPDEEFSLGDFQISSMESNHPGGCSLLRISDQEETLVTGFDFNHADGYDKKLVEFAKNADILLYDGNMTEEEYVEHPSWGHSTARKGLEIARLAEVKNLVVTHHGSYSDKFLSKMEKELIEYHQEGKFTYPQNVSYARVGKRKEEQSRSLKLDRLLNFGINMSNEEDGEKLLESLLMTAMDVTDADGGTIYVLKDSYLYFKLMVCKSRNVYKGSKGEPIDLPPVEVGITNICGACVLEDRLINIKDAYSSEEYYLRGPVIYDQLTGYKTKSVMAVPIRENQNDIIGVLELLNATDENGDIIIFDKADEKICLSIASQAAICLNNMHHQNQMEELLSGFVRVFSAGVDARTSYNTYHSENMVKLCKRFLEYEQRCNGKYVLQGKEFSELLFAIWLHDIGKIAIPSSIMEKSSRLGSHLVDVVHRFERMNILLEIDCVKGLISKEEKQQRQAENLEDLELIKSHNGFELLPSGHIDILRRIAEKSYQEFDGSVVNYLTEKEIEELSILKGTLTQQEREMMQEHVEITAKMLQQLAFPAGYEKIPIYAGAHHELMDGSGYPNHLIAEDLPWQVRLITILDIYEALTATFRPYKEQFSQEKAFETLQGMANEGKLDSEILEEFIKSEVWKDIEGE